MARKANMTQLESLRRAIKMHAGQRASFYAKLLGCHRQTISRMLVMLNDNGVLLYEDENGKLWPLTTKDSN